MTTASLPCPNVTPAHEPVRSYQLLAPAIPEAVRVAREFVTTVLEAGGHLGLVDDARLCVSDVVSNVVQHAGSAMLSVQVTDYGDRVLVEVRDGNPALRPHPRATHQPTTGTRPGVGCCLCGSSPPFVGSIWWGTGWLL
ncbi:ATP-binding protein [Streptomyces luteireticuli]|uniref:ATP-binding protein n=1 Tax=Streptomyces luteireticuli TaxID=173858 RepID=UPI0035560196